MCIYDKNGIPCCTKNLDMVHGWFKNGWVEGDTPPLQAWYKHSGGDAEKAAKDIYGYKYAMHTDQIYHLNSFTKNSMWRNKEVPQTRWNFECPTHHPVPTVAILLGNS